MHRIAPGVNQHHEQLELVLGDSLPMGVVDDQKSQLDAAYSELR